MGFETANLPQGPALRPSLKVPYGIWNSRAPISWALVSCLKVPYGIWNFVRIPPARSSESGFESSLWDLKRWGWVAGSNWGAVWKFPMGFETTPAKLVEPYRNCVWKFPMGFETSLWHTCGDAAARFESSLWDLKQSGDFQAAVGDPMFESSLWDLKLRSPLALSYGAIVWKFPMGFETAQALRNVWEIDCLKVPYGIWNLKQTCLQG